MNKRKLVRRLIKAITRYEKQYDLMRLCRLDDSKMPDYYVRIYNLRSKLLTLVGTNHPFFSRCKK
jgi:hypothetical protein